jgi:membrane-bound lytic murein transglycosylase F
MDGTSSSYNMGYGNIMKAQKITKKMGNDPNKWLDVSRHLRHLPRAGQALVYVQEVRRYYDALLLTTTKHSWVASIDGKQQRVVQ